MTPAAWGRALGLGAALATAAAPPPAAAQVPLYLPDTALPVTIRTDLRALKGDRDTLTVHWRDATLTYAGESGPVTLPLTLRTRGGYRLLHCDFPPVRLRFDSTAHGTLFQGVRRPKLAAPCRNSAEYEQFILEEYAIYRVLRIFTPVGFGARLLRVTWEDAAGRSRPVTHYAFLTEDAERLARRLDATPLAVQGAPLGRLSPSFTALLGVFQYFIGNTDWSVPGLHNILLVKAADTTWTVPFDFDWSGVIETPYAIPSRQLPIRSVRERIYRGFCQGPTALEPALARFEAARDTITALYRSLPGLWPRRLEHALAYYGDFYDAIKDRPAFLQDVVQRDCRP